MTCRSNIVKRQTQWMMFFVWTKAPADDHQADVNSVAFAPDWPDTGNTEQLTLTCHFTPLVLSTMTKYSDDSQYTVTVSIFWLNKSYTMLLQIKKKYYEKKRGVTTWFLTIAAVNNLLNASRMNIVSLNFQWKGNWFSQAGKSFWTHSTSLQENLS